MSGRLPEQDFVEPMILRILKKSEMPMPLLAINYWVNENSKSMVNRSVIKSNLAFLVNHNRISEKLDRKNGIVYYELIL